MPRARPTEIQLLRSEILALRQLLEAHEQVVAEQSARLERTVAELVSQNAALEESEREKSELVRRLRLAIEEISTPILEVGHGMLALPVIGVLDAKRAAYMMDRLLGEIAAKRARVAILDVTGVAELDAQAASHFIQMSRAISLLGARCILSGIQPSVAEALVRLGIDLGEIRTAATLQHAIREGRLLC